MYQTLPICDQTLSHFREIISESQQHNMQAFATYKARQEPIMTMTTHTQYVHFIYRYI